MKIFKETNQGLGKIIISWATKMCVIRLLLIFLLLPFGFSCTNTTEKETIHDEEYRNNFLEIENILQLPTDFQRHTLRITNNVSIKSGTPVIEESIIISYYNTPIRAIYTPLCYEEDSLIKMFHVYFELNGKVSTFDLLITEKNLSNKMNQYTYKTIDGIPIVSFDVDVNTGQLINIERNPIKSWGDRFGNCVDWTFDNMNRWDYLACMAVGPICAGVIASMCAVAANEGMFVQPDIP